MAGGGFSEGGVGAGVSAGGGATTGAIMGGCRQAKTSSKQQQQAETRQEAGCQGVGWEWGQVLVSVQPQAQSQAAAGRQTQRFPFGNFVNVQSNSSTSIVCFLRA
jgi:hypothetical protein